MIASSSFLTVIILAKDEEKHIERALASVAAIADRCYVIDSGSSDRTVELSRAAGAVVLENPWINHATQFNWALDQLPADTQWVMRLDADEVVTEPLANEIQMHLGTIAPEIAGIIVSRRMCFLGRPIKWGGVFPIRIARLFRYGKGRVENRWMDEHIVVDGPLVHFRGEIIDDNLNSLSWWISKHNTYASLEAIEMLNREFQFFPRDEFDNRPGGQGAKIKRWLKNEAYFRLPAGVRALFYFIYRYIIRLGFLDGFEGTAFHVLQGFWYRFLVDMKLKEVRSHMLRHNSSANAAIFEIFGINIEVE